MATGKGRTLGEALANALAAAGWQRGREAKGWHARLSALTKTQRGQQALLGAGVAPGERARNWRAWLGEDRAPSKANQERIAAAYRAYRLPPWVRNAHAKITGEIETEQGRTRNRGVDEAPLLVDHGAGTPSRQDQKWQRIEDEWQKAVEEDSYDDLEDAYVDDVIGDDMDMSVFETGSGGYVVAIG